MRELSRLYSKLIFSKESFVVVRFSFIILALDWFISSSLPAEVGWENGIIENAQVVVLAMGVILSRSFACYCKKGGFRGVTDIFLLMVGRELSWGRVFLTPTEVTDMGPCFPSMKTLAYWPVVYLCIGLLMLKILYNFYREIDWKFYLQKPIPLGFLVIIFISVIMHYLGEHNMIYGLTHGQSQIYEEIAELVIYINLLYLTLYYGFLTVVAREKIKWQLSIDKRLEV